MPQLPANLVEPTEEASQSEASFAVLETGVYTGRLSKCEAGQSKGVPPKPMWRLEFDQIQNLDGSRAMGGRLFSNLTLEESTAWKIAQFFAAFDVPTSTNTDMLINSRIRLEVVQRIQDYSASKRFGMPVNDVDRYVPLTDEDDGYEKAQQLKAKLSGKKAAPVKAAAPKAAPIDGDSPFEPADDDDSVDF